MPLPWTQISLPLGQYAVFFSALFVLIASTRDAVYAVAPWFVKHRGAGNVGRAVAGCLFIGLVDFHPSVEPKTYAARHDLALLRLRQAPLLHVRCQLPQHDFGSCPVDASIGD